MRKNPFLCADNLENASYYLHVEHCGGTSNTELQDKACRMYDLVHSSDYLSCAPTVPWINLVGSFGSGKNTLWPEIEASFIEFGIDSFKTLGLRANISAFQQKEVLKDRGFIRGPDYKASVKYSIPAFSLEEQTALQQVQEGRAVCTLGGTLSQLSMSTILKDVWENPNTPISLFLRDEQNLLELLQSYNSLSEIIIALGYRGELHLLETAFILFAESSYHNGFIFQPFITGGLYISSFTPEQILITTNKPREIRRFYGSFNNRPAKDVEQLLLQKRLFDLVLLYTYPNRVFESVVYMENLSNDYVRERAQWIIQNEISRINL